ncbi:SpoIIE family protein phosphatase [Chitinimonas viridis]|uniref:SpoIIE family protein phosphatase n=1 Tax=Chitinimonas viridis TaxID=664880 RepID=A0ABT8B602_9NEIS|nr:SpoIIE family protein phosphatase [Chitinimonas viridis]MDN3577444.1 SpoIIE family protein phosphatase [Chitinimonas viridis]
MDLLSVDHFRRQTVHRLPSAGGISSEVDPVAPDTTNVTVLSRFARDRDLVSLPVVESGVPIGLINRNAFMSEMSSPQNQERYGPQGCTAFMDRDPLIVDEKLNLEALSFRVVEHGEQTLAAGFIVTRDGLYAGVGSCLRLMRMIANLQAEKNRQIRHSIEYAGVIQQAMMRAAREALAHTLQDSELVWEPRDVVGGDFYHFARFQDGWFGAVADCTGHGVPGAFMTLITSSLLVQAIEQSNPRDPAAVLSELNRAIKLLLGQTGPRAGFGQSDDGLDGAFFWFDEAKRTLTYAAAKTPLFVLDQSSEDFVQLDGDRMGVGYVDTPMDFCWSNQVIAAPQGTLMFVTTDGLVDQIGGPKQTAFGKRRIRESIIAQRNERADVISMSVLNAYSLWQADQPRRDDLTFLCFRP